MVKLFQYQKNALKNLKSGSILCGGVGSGKTLTALAYYVWKEKPRPLYVITTAKKRNSKEWESDAGKIEVLIEAVDSWNNIKKYVSVENSFFIFDEQKLVGSGAWVKSFLKIAKNNHWILLSATPGDNWMDYVAVFIANGFYKNRTEFIRRHVIYNSHTTYPKIDRYVDTRHLEFFKKEILVTMSYVHDIDVKILVRAVRYDEEKFKLVKDRRWNPYKDCPIQALGELYFLMRKVANEDQSRIDRLIDIWKKHRKLIVFYNFDYELEALRELSRLTNVAEYNGHYHQDIPNEEEWIYLVNYNSGAEGWNCIKTNVIVFFSLSYSYKIMKQASGRIDRLNTPYEDLYYYVLKSDSYIDRVILRALREKRTFNEKDI